MRIGVNAASFVPPTSDQKLPFGLAACFLNMSESVSYSKILSLATKIKAMLPPPPMTEVKASRPTCVVPLSLEELNQQALSLDLSKQGVVGVCQDTLVESFIEYLKKLRQVYEAQYEIVFVIWQQHDLYDEKYNKSFRNLLHRIFAMHSQATWHMILDGASKVFGSDSSLTFTQRFDASDERAAIKTSRGHDSDTIRILEKAFEHTPSITPAEKFRLAEVTGLKPKQVTIWVSA